MANDTVAELRAKEEGEPIASFLKMRILELTPGYAKVVMPVTLEYQNFNGLIFGGMIMAVTDQAFAYASNSVAYPSVASQFNIHFIAGASAGDGAFGFGFQAGAIFRPNDLVAIGASFNSTQYFSDFEFNTTYDNPYVPDGTATSFGMPRTITFNMDVPMMIGAGSSVGSARMCCCSLSCCWIGLGAARSTFTSPASSAASMAPRVMKPSCSSSGLPPAKAAVERPTKKAVVAMKDLMCSPPVADGSS